MSDPTFTGIEVLVAACLFSGLGGYFLRSLQGHPIGRTRIALIFSGYVVSVAIFVTVGIRALMRAHAVH